MSLVKTWYLVLAGRRLNEIQPVSLPNDKLIKLRNNISIPLMHLRSELQLFSFSLFMSDQGVYLQELFVFSCYLCCSVAVGQYCLVYLSDLWISALLLSVAISV